MSTPDRDGRHGDRSWALASLLSVLPALFVGAVLPGGRHEPGDRTGDCLQVARGILVQPNAGDLEPPSIADENNGGQGDDAGSGEEIPPGLDQRVPALE